MRQTFQSPSVKFDWSNKKLIAQQFGLHLGQGFIRTQDQAKQTKNTFWAKMASAVSQIMQNPQLNAREILEQAISEAPEFIIPENHEEAMFALRDLCFIQNAILHHKNSDPSNNKIPEKLATPLLALSKKVGIPPLMSYPLYILYNAKEAKPDLTEIKLDALNTFTKNHKKEANTDNNLTENADHNDEAHFIRIHLAIEQSSLGLFNAMFEILAINPADFEAQQEKIKEQLLKMKCTLKEMKDALNMMYIGTGLNAFNDMRVFLKGTQEFKDGVYSDQTNTPLSNHPGGSGAQTPLFMLIDNFLGVKLEGKAKEFREAQKEFMLPQAKELGAAIERDSKEAIAFIDQHKELQPLLKDLTDELLEYRKSHMKMVSTYIQAQQGTGGTDPSKTLGEIMKATQLATTDNKFKAKL